LAVIKMLQGNSFEYGDMLREEGGGGVGNLLLWCVYVSCVKLLEYRVQRHTDELKDILYPGIFALAPSMDVARIVARHVGSYTGASVQESLYASLCWRVAEYSEWSNGNGNS
jgi:hypothetical protein